MGLDVRILFQTVGEDVDFSELACCPDFTVHELSPDDWKKDDYPDATHELECGFRYYDIGYERGPWPKICAALMALQSIPEIEQVWYGSDCGNPYECPPERILETSKHYMEVGHRPYYQEEKP